MAQQHRTSSDGTVKAALVGKLGPGGYGRLLQQLHLMALPNADKIPPAGEES